MTHTRKPRKKVDVKAVEKGRERGLSYEEIARLLDVSSSAVWYAVNRKKGADREFPAGKPRSLYATDARWALLDVWAQAEGVSRSLCVAKLVDEEAARRAGEPTIHEPEVTQ